MNYRPARWVPPTSPKTPAVCEECGAEHFSVFYIYQTLGLSQCEICLREKTESVSASSQ